MRLFFIILSQFLSGSIWFAANVAYMGQGFLLSAIQFGFIIGTLAFAFLNISDRFSPARVFFLSALLGAVFNFSGIFLETHKSVLLMSRMLCGVSLAGIYPVGMKIAASWYPQTISRALGWLVGALVLAAGFPYLIKALNWQGNIGSILQVTSVLCLTGGLIQLFLVGDGPHLPKGSKFDLGVIKDIFRHPGFRAASFGYFGHMWELYAVFAYIPLLFGTIVKTNVELWTFGFFIFGFLGCAVGGIIALRVGSRKIALVVLFMSGSICLVSPFLQNLPQGIALIIIQIWGVTVVADSPQFSSLNTQFAPRKYVGSALTIVNCIGFLITIITIELLSLWINWFGVRTAFLPLVIGPIFGWISLRAYPCQHRKTA
ncbi:MFS transporter [Desulfobacula sp.]|uniref:MFS transporter n=1 Tax=Desulfobacula sp. TaxID=2593537 RepID=UPI002627FF78|nr:MFS transporter [Desulfobacula sp.]